MFREPRGIDEVSGLAESQMILFLTFSGETLARDLAIGFPSDPGSAANLPRAGLGRSPAPFGDVATHVLKPEFVGFFCADRRRATAINQILAGADRVVPVPRDLVQIITPAEAHFL